MSDVTSLLMSLGSPDQMVRVPAEQMVTQAKEADLAGFLLALLAEFRDESKPSFARNMAGSLLKNSVALPLRDVSARRELERKWKSLPSDVRKRVKDEVLLTLGSPAKDVRGVAANIIGNLSRIELPAGEWPDLLSILLAGVESGSDQNQEAALTAIGYICEEGREHSDVEAALKPHTNNILTAVVRGMASNNEDVRYYATNALCNSMEFIHDNMERQDHRDQLVSALCATASSCQTTRTREKAMESLVKVADMHYATLPNYISQLHTITCNAISQDEESVGLQAMLFWTSICETEHDMKSDGDVTHCHNYASQGAQVISDIALKAMMQQEEDQTEDSWNISVAGGKLLQSLAECIGDQVVDIVMPFVYRNVTSTNWREKEAAVMALGCILTGPDPKTIQDTVAQAVPGLLQYIRDPNPLLADTSGWVLAVICQSFADVFIEVPSNLQQLMNIVGPMIGQGYSTSEEAQMAIRACHIVHNLALYYEEEENQATNELSQYFADLLGVLLSAVDKGNTSALRGIAQETLNVLVDATAADCYPLLVALVPQLHYRLIAILDGRAQGTLSNMDALSTLGLLCGTLGGVAKKLQDAFVGPFLEPSMQILLRILQSQQDTILDEALVMLGSFSHVAKRNLTPYIEHVIPFILRALQSVDEPELTTVAVGTMGDLSLSLQEVLGPYIEAVLNTILTNLQNPDVDRDLKCSFLGCLGDIALNVGGNSFSPFLDAFMGIAGILFQQSSTLNVDEDAENEEYVMCLWESLAEFYTGVCQSFKGDGMERLAPFLKGILQFALHAATHSREYTDVLDAAVSLIGDMACVLKSAPSPELRQQGKSALLSQNVQSVVQHAVNSSRGTESANQMQWVSKQLMLLDRS